MSTTTADDDGMAPIDEPLLPEERDDLKARCSTCGASGPAKAFVGVRVRRCQPCAAKLLAGYRRQRKARARAGRAQEMELAAELLRELGRLDMPVLLPSKLWRGKPGKAIRAVRSTGVWNA